MTELFEALGPWGLMAAGAVLTLLLVAVPLLIWALGLRARAQASAAAREVFGTQMQALANDALHQNRESFLSMAQQTMQSTQALAAKDLEQRQQGMAALIKPLKEQVDLYRQQTGQEQGALKAQIESLTRLGQDMSQQASALRQALTTGPKGAGAWGEQQLRNVMEMAGMAEHVDFDLQATTTGEAGQRLRPDAKVNLAGNGSLIIDAKAPLEAFLDSYEAEGQEREDRLNQFLLALRRHVGELGKKAYWDQFKPAPEFVILFLPNDTMMMTAFDREPSLLQWALNQRVILASPSTLIAMLTTVAVGWRQASLNENAQEIADLGKKLYDAMATVGAHYEKLGGTIEKSAKAYNDMIGSIKRNVMPKARRFRDLQHDPGLRSLSEPTGIEDVQVQSLASEADFQLEAPED